MLPHMTEINLVSSNIRNQLNLTAEYDWNQHLEAEVSYERYIQDYFRVVGGINIENDKEARTKHVINNRFRRLQVSDTLFV
jgi:hypothetical protein